MEALVLLEGAIDPRHGYPSWIARANENDGRFEVDDDTQDHALEALETYQKQAGKSESPGKVIYVKFDES